MTFCRRFFIWALLPALGASCRQRELPGGEVRLRVTRLAASKAKTPEDIAPYDEAIAWHEYRVDKVLDGKLDAENVRVAHWTVLRGRPLDVARTPGETIELRLRPFQRTAELRDVASSDDLDVIADEPPRYIDIGQSLAQNQTPQALRFDYGGEFSQQMKLYWRLRGQLRLVVMGNSHATKGICTSLFFGEANLQSPAALNLAPAGANNHQQCIMVRDYLMPLPKLEWVIWVLSARSFNQTREDNRKMREFLTSPGYLHDQKHRSELWPAPPEEVRTEQLRSLSTGRVDLWGWEGRSKSLLPASLDEARPELLKLLREANFRFNETAWSEFSETVGLLSRRNVHVLLVTTPFHPVSRETYAADPDDTTQEGQRELVTHGERLAAAAANVWFHDFNRGEHHDFVHDEFYDADHLNHLGARHLTRLIIEWMGALQAESD